MLVLCIGVSDIASAFETPLTNPKGRQLLEKMGKQLQPIAAEFGCDAFAWGNIVGDGRIAAFEYIPKNSGRVEKWKRMVTITIYTLTGDQKTDLQLLDNIADELTKSIKKNAKVLQYELFRNQHKEPGMFLEYEIGKDAAKEHNAGVFLRIMNTSAAFIQYQSRPDKLSKADVEKVRSLLGPPNPATAPTEKKPAKE